MDCPGAGLQASQGRRLPGGLEGVPGREVSEGSSKGNSIMMARRHRRAWHFWKRPGGCRGVGWDRWRGDTRLSSLSGMLTFQRWSQDHSLLQEQHLTHSFSVISQMRSQRRAEGAAPQRPPVRLGTQICWLLAGDRLSEVGGGSQEGFIQGAETRKAQPCALREGWAGPQRVMVRDDSLGAADACYLCLFLCESFRAKKVIE